MNQFRGLLDFIIFMCNNETRAPQGNVQQVKK